VLKSFKNAHYALFFPENAFTGNGSLWNFSPEARSSVAAFKGLKLGYL